MILGGPGSGKTTLAVQLLLGLLGTRAPEDPVPVLLTLAGWDLAAHPRLQDWVAARLGEDYPALRALDAALPRALVDHGMVVPVLDGLDELPKGYRPQVLTALNASLGATVWGSNIGILGLDLRVTVLNSIMLRSGTRW